ncbi:hypothetical protein ACIQOU_13245 [Streptomyces sp. NPDC091279]|uniref:hypothetical protein n=1 Tax=unclassified Streptomyces TaxID=2593676 RepID=UPI00380D05D2
MQLAGLPGTVTAHRVRQQLARRWGSAGEELFADAFQVAVYWWTRMPDTVCWVLGAGCGEPGRLGWTRGRCVRPRW